MASEENSEVAAAMQAAEVASSVAAAGDVLGGPVYQNGPCCPDSPQGQDCPGGPSGHHAPGGPDGQGGAGAHGEEGGPGAADGQGVADAPGEEGGPGAADGQGVADAPGEEGGPGAADGQGVADAPGEGGGPGAADGQGGADAPGEEGGPGAADGQGVAGVSNDQVGPDAPGGPGVEEKEGSAAMGATCAAPEPDEDAVPEIVGSGDVRIVFIITVPFQSHLEAEIVRKFMDVSTQGHNQSIRKEFRVHGRILAVWIAEETRGLQQSVNTFFDQLSVVMENIHQFGYFFPLNLGRGVGP